jgi:hypothetical protein
MKTLFALLALVASIAFGQTPPMADAPKEPRDLGNRAVLHIYWYAPKTLEITHSESYLFKDVDACKDAITKGLAIASMYASEGDLVAASCVGMHPPEHSGERATPKGSTGL